MTLEFTEPLFLLSAQTGLSVSELQAQAAEGNPDIGAPISPMKIGEPIPIVFCRRRTVNSVEAGGTMVIPKATEGSFTNNQVIKKAETNSAWFDIAVDEELSIKLLLVVSDGEIGLAQVRDIFYGDCRRGTVNQAYNARAGNWAPGNTIDDYIAAVVPKSASGFYIIPTIVPGNWYRFDSSLFAKIVYDANGNTLDYSRPYKEHKAPTFCGTSGSYSGLTTLSFELTLSGSSDWNKTVSVFVREGLKVTRLVDGTLGSSDNFADLAKYLMLNNGRLPGDLINDSLLTTAAKFADANGFFFNGVLAKSQNLPDWLQKTSYGFLLRLTNTNGKFGLKPRLPYNTDHTIKTTAIIPKFTFTEDHILSGGFEIESISLEDREPVCIVAQWRQQGDADFGLVRTVEVRYPGEATSGPFVSMDMSGYCVTENHAIKVATYKLATRKHITHHLRLTVRERSYNSTLEVGDIVRTRLRRESSEGEVTYHDKVYEIARIEKTFSSKIKYDLIHFPIDNQGRSIVARAVAGAAGAGNTINTGISTFNCANSSDSNSSTNTTNVGTASSTQGNPPSSGDTENDVDVPQDPDNQPSEDSLYPNATGLPGSPYSDGSSNPVDPIDQPIAETASTTGSNTGYGGSSSTPGNAVEVSTTALACPNGRVCYYRLDKATGVKTLRECKTEPIAGKFTSFITTADINYAIVVEGECPDPSTDTGYGTPIPLGETPIVIPDPSQYSYARFTGVMLTYSFPSNEPVVQTITTTWKTWDGTNPTPAGAYLTVGTAVTGIGGFIYGIRIIDPYFTNPYTENGNFLEWTPAVNYYSLPQGAHIGLLGITSVPWRAHVGAVARRFTGSGGTGVYLGDIGGQGYNIGVVPDPFPSSFSSPDFYAYLPPDNNISAPTRRVRISGSWEFSNDTSDTKTVMATWKGTDDNGDPYIASADDTLSLGT
jgi:hypothetical protein